MTEANKDVEGAIENNEQEMIDEGAPVQPSTDPVLDGGDDDPAGPGARAHLRRGHGSARSAGCGRP